MKPLRMAIFCNGYWLTRWQWETIRQLIDSGAAVPVLLIMNDGTPGKKGFITKLSSYLNKRFLLKLYTRYIWKIPSLVPVYVENELKDIPMISCRTQRKGKFSEYFSPEDIQRIKAFQPDFALRFGFNIIRGEILEVPVHGVWSYHHGDERDFRGGPPGFWEIYRNSSVNGVVLQKLNNLIDAGVILERRSYQTVFHSYRDHLEKILSQNTDMPLKACRRILNGDSAFIAQPHSATKATMNISPHNGQMLIFIGKMLRNRLRFYVQKYMQAEDWMVGRTQMTINAFLEKFPDIPVMWTRNRKGAYYADPFVINDQLRVEDYSYRNNKGKLVRFSDDTHTPAEELASKDIHLAYPYTFRLGDEIYMVPETSEEGNIQLYKWNAATEQMEFSTVLMDIPGVDSSLYFDGKYYWIFTGIKGHMPNEKLFLFYAAQLEGPYLPHLQNPVVTDPCGARMAGNFILKDNIVLRPSQYSRDHYGQKVILQKINILDPENYSEEICMILEPPAEWEFHEGMHTLSHNGDTVAWDVKKRKSSLVSFIAQFKK